MFLQTLLPWGFLLFFFAFELLHSLVHLFAVVVVVVVFAVVSRGRLQATVEQSASIFSA